jgi:hypothetical protein
LAYLFADDDKGLQFLEGTGLLMKEMKWCKEKVTMVNLRIKTKV